MAINTQMPVVANQKQVVNTVSLTPQAFSTVFSVQSFTINGLDPKAHQFTQVGADTAGTQSQTTGVYVTGGFVAAANSLSIIFMNTTGGSVTPVAGYYSYTVE